ncbi:hypothetical protein E1B28_008531 [Marasmius oreades]|uniref:P-loop containing nucleoside triphosphate hydrolase protein n=1 Tax=Marasmius oreades TaxID=181124 RepID=A0A9P7URV5_9AGAR|nr:uncharacterized protein E1B28_008531 [Marasmius oreades]KAG7092162.1 hypothetical protein E1B28_008531 [Marasmius oreades]
MSSKRKASKLGEQTREKRIRKFMPAETPQDSEWPEYFHLALNTVLAFVTSRRQLATSFHTIRSSVENITKEPIDISKIAELKALLPDIIRFAYVPSSSIRVNLPSAHNEPDFSSECLKRATSVADEDENVLTLEFAEFWGGGQTKQSSTLAQSRTPAATKKLVERRNERFMKAVEELISAASPSEDPVSLLKTAAREHIPVQPGALAQSSSSMLEDSIHIAIPEPEHRPSVDEIVEEIKNQVWFKNQIIEQRTVEPKQGNLREIELSDNIRQALESSRGISSLYSHQVSSIEALSRGRHVIVSTSTASGKTVIYQAPLLQFLEDDPSSTAIFVYPTKALAQDQKASLENLLSACPGLEHIQVATYDGDTPTENRRKIRETASVIFTNFDMIHAAILPYEEYWRRFLKSLNLFVVDELHYYSGTLGSHIAMITRRFRRLCAAVGNRRVKFVSCSATIANPKRHMETIFGVEPEEVEAVVEDGAPSGAKKLIIWRPPYVDEMETAMGRVGALQEATGLMRFLMKRGLRVILFCKHRKVCELVMKTLRTELTAEGRHDILERVQAYRGGYSIQDRRKIEHDAFTGQLVGIVATNALELGVDIGVLDAVLMLGFPITLASFKQQAGRAGRRRKDSLVVFVAQNLPVDQYYAENPGELLDGQTDDLVIDLESEEILEAHLQCAAYEMPISLEDERYFGPLMREICESKLVKDNDNWYHTHPRCLPSPSKLVSIRGTMEVKYVLVDVTSTTRKILEEIEISRALFEVYEGGVFLHQGKTFIVKEISHDSRIASLMQADVNWITTPRDFTDVNALQTSRIREIRGSPHRAYYGKIEVRCQVFGFYKMRGTVVLDVIDLENDPWEQTTTGLWLDVPDNVLFLLREKLIKPASAIHSASHALLNQFALSQDLRTECKAKEKEYLKKESRRKRPARVMIYDTVGHSGIAAKAFDHVNNLLNKARNAIETCGCSEGCTKCVLSPGCREANKVNSKAGALAVLKGILNVYIDPDTIPFETDERALGGHDSIVYASPVHSRANISIESESTTT